MFQRNKNPFGLVISESAKTSLKDIAEKGRQPIGLDSATLFKVALEAAVVGTYADWLRLYSSVKSRFSSHLETLSPFDKKLIRWVETKGKTLGFEEKDRRFTMLSIAERTLSPEKLEREDVLFHFLDTLDFWSAKIGKLLCHDERSVRSMRHEVLGRLKSLEWADTTTILRTLEHLREDIDRLGEVDFNARSTPEAKRFAF